MREIKRVYIHHTAGRRDLMNIDDVERDLISTGMRKYGRPLKGYHYVITGPGVTHVRIPIDQPGEHAAGDNPNSIGIALTGNFEKEKITPAQLVALDALLTRILIERPSLHYWNIYGHRQAKETFKIPGATATACPGKNLYALLPAIRRAVGISVGQIKKEDHAMLESIPLKGGNDMTEVKKVSPFAPAFLFGKITSRKFLLAIGSAIALLQAGKYLEAAVVIAVYIGAEGAIDAIAKLNQQ